MITEYQTVVPMEVRIPTYWSTKHDAVLQTMNGKLVASVHRVIRYSKRFLGIPFSHMETLECFLRGASTPLCSVDLHARFPLEFRSPDGASVGLLCPKPLSIVPEYEFFGQDGQPFGRLRIGIQHADIMCLDQEARLAVTTSRLIKGPRQVVWQCTSANTSVIDIRLLMAFIALGQMDA